MAHCIVLCHILAYAGCFESCKLLLEAGADPNLADTSFKDRRTALHKAASCGHEQVLELLIAYGGDPGVVDAGGLTPAQVLAQSSEEPTAGVTAPLGQTDSLASDATDKTGAVVGTASGTGATQSVGSGVPTVAGDMTAGTSCPVCGNRSLLFTRFLRGGLVCLDCYSKR